MNRPLTTLLALGSLVLLATPAYPAALAQLEIHRDGVAPVDGLDEPRSVALSPDGLHVYVAGALDNAVAVFERNATTGAVAFVQVVRDEEGGVNGLAGAQAVAVSPDGLHVYVASKGDDAVAVFRRDAATGMLAFRQVLLDDGVDPIDGVDGLRGAEALALSPDGANVYVAADVDDAVVVFHRDAVTGLLSFVETQKDGGLVDGLKKARAVAVSPDGASVYVAGTGENAVAVFHRDAVEGRLSFVERHVDGLGGVDGLALARALAISPDGASVYVGGGDDDAIALFTRDSATGALLYVEPPIRDGAGVDGLDGVRDLTVTADGTRLYAASSGDNAVAAFARDPATGLLTFLEAVKHKNGVTALDDADAVATSPDGRHVYAVAAASDSLTVFLTHCGDGVVDADEQCDDGNNKSGDCCSSACRLDAAGSACTSDKNGCTDDVCDGAGVCQHLNNTLPCDDGKFCTVNDACQDGACQAGAPLDCSGAADQCTDGVCDESNDRCGRPKADGTVCDDGNACTQTDACAAGACTGGNPVACVAQDQCHAAGDCDPATGQCSNPAKPNGSACDDGNACTRTDTCQAGSCAPGAPVTCTAADQCHTAGVCDPATGQCSNPAKPNGSACDDGNTCTRTDTCQAGSCTPGAPVTCTAADQCHTAGVCDPATGQCSSPAKADGSACDDGNACTRADACQGGRCTPGEPLVCSADDACHAGGTCDPATGECTDAPAPDGTACDDGDPCTVGDACAAGTCRAGTLSDRDGDRVCDALDVCPDIDDPAQSDRNGDGTGDACECSAAAAARCLTGGGPKKVDCLVEFNPSSGALIAPSGIGKLRCVDGEPACDRDGHADGACSFGVAICVGNADPRLPQCRPTDMVSLEVVSPNPERSGVSMDRENGLALEQGMTALGLEVRRAGRVIAQATAPSEPNLCSPLVELHAPAPTGARRKPIRRKLKIRGQAVDGRRDTDVLVVECAR